MKLDYYNDNADKEVSENIPFEDSEKYDFFNGLYFSVKMLVKTPREFFDKMHVNKGYLKPLFFLFIMLFLSGIFQMFYVNTGIISSPKLQMLETVESIKSSAEGSEQLDETYEEMKKEYEESGGKIVFTEIVAGIGINILILLSLIYIWHTGLVMVGVSRNGFEATWRVVCYSSVTFLSGLLPLGVAFTNILMFVWGIILLRIGLEEAHEVSKKRALMGTLLLPIGIMIVTIIVGSIIF